MPKYRVQVLGVLLVDAESEEEAAMKAQQRFQAMDKVAWVLGEQEEQTLGVDSAHMGQVTRH